MSTHPLNTTEHIQPPASARSTSISSAPPFRLDSERCFVGFRCNTEGPQPGWREREPAKVSRLRACRRAAGSCHSVPGTGAGSARETGTGSGSAVAYTLLETWMVRAVCAVVHPQGDLMSELRADVISRTKRPVSRVAAVFIRL
jgi:hypothetical protein